VAKKTEKEMQREQIAQDIKKYLARGGVVRTYAHGESVVEERKNNATWEKRLRAVPTKKGN
tara:strand:+ start:642 stop:824 length:183 start_codon:yes stop_codon:yes gene_type:complete